MKLLQIGEIFRLSTTSHDNEEFIDDCKNFIYYTKSEHIDSTSRNEKGIHRTKQIKAIDGDRSPVIIVSSSSYKSGTESTPWKDIYDPNNGIAIYYGDCKSSDVNPSESEGNNILMSEWKKHCSNDKKQREQAIPIMFFERIKKGYLKFHGLGVIEKASLITQKTNNSEFANFEFEFCILDLTNENNCIDWDWISDRSNKDLTTKKANEKAPKAWKKWVSYGNDKIEAVRRHVLSTKIIKEDDQKIPSNSLEDKIIKIIENHYNNKKLMFELFALNIAQFYFKENNIKYLEGYITKGSGDKGIDFISRIDIGSELSGLKLVVIGQAKCQKETISGKDIARTIAKLKRNYIGVFVTNSIFSKNTQEEIYEDQYPLIMINGAKIAQLVNKYILDSSKDLNILKDYLDNLDSQYEKYKSNIRPDDILYK